MTIFFRVSFFSIEEASDFEAKVKSLTMIESIAPRDREQHRQWCNLSEDQYTDLFGTPEEQEEWESRTMDAWFGTPNWGLPKPCFFDSNGIAI